jgi:hypothetical protein
MTSVVSLIHGNPVCAEPNAAADQGRITVVRGMLSLQRPRLLSVVVMRQRGADPLAVPSTAAENQWSVPSVLRLPRRLRMPFGRMRS